MVNGHDRAPAIRVIASVKMRTVPNFRRLALSAATDRARAMAAHSASYAA